MVRLNVIFQIFMLFGIFLIATGLAYVGNTLWVKSVVGPWKMGGGFTFYVFEIAVSFVAALALTTMFFSVMMQFLGQGMSVFGISAQGYPFSGITIPGLIALPMVFLLMLVMGALIDFTINNFIFIVYFSLFVAFFFRIANTWFRAIFYGVYEG